MGPRKSKEAAAAAIEASAAAVAAPGQEVVEGQENTQSKAPGRKGKGKGKAAAAAKEPGGRQLTQPKAVAAPPALTADAVESILPEHTVLYIFKVTEKLLASAFGSSLVSSLLDADTTFYKFVVGDTVVMSVHTRAAVSVDGVLYPCFTLRHFSDVDEVFMRRASRSSDIHNCLPTDDTDYFARIKTAFFDEYADGMPAELHPSTVFEGDRIFVRSNGAAEVSAARTFAELMRAETGRLSFDNVDSKKLVEHKDKFTLEAAKDIITILETVVYVGIGKRTTQGKRKKGILGGAATPVASTSKASMEVATENDAADEAYFEDDDDNIADLENILDFQAVEVVKTPPVTPKKRQSLAPLQPANSPTASPSNKRMKIIN